MYDRAKFFAGVKPLFGQYSPSQIQGIDDVLDVIDATAACSDPRFSAYICCTVHHETGKLWVPVREGFAKTDAAARAAVASLFAKGKISKNYALPVNGVSYYGRGRVQNTFQANYAKLEKRFGKPFVANPDLLLDSKTDALVTVVGHVEGIWTGKKLADYFGKQSDPVGARHIVNGSDRAAMIAGYYRTFLNALVPTS